VMVPSEGGSRRREHLCRRTCGWSVVGSRGYPCTCSGVAVQCYAI